MEDTADRITLKVKRSPISGRGIGRVHLSVLETLNLSESKNIEVGSGGSSIIVKVVADNLISPEIISLRVNDMKKLGVREGDEVSIIAHRQVGIFRKKRWFS